jgi:uncharacterized membrane protein
MEKTLKELEDSFHKDPKNWKFFGAFYYCKADRRLVIDKPNPNYGTTLNFAHPKSYLFLGLCLLFFGFVGYMITRNQ